MYYLLEIKIEINKREDKNKDWKIGGIFEK